MKKPTAVLISDIHYRVDTLDLADMSLRQAIQKASKLRLPLYICGDTNDTKAVIRGEVANKLIGTLNWARVVGVKVHVLVGNHDLLNEKGRANSLEFLRPWCNLISEPQDGDGITCMPYYSDPNEFVRDFLRITPKGRIVLIHQGVKGANAGHYIQDHSAVDAEILKDYRTFGGHYHNHHKVGTHTFIGNPYTLTFGEANDHSKGFLVLYEDGTYEHVPTNLRKHIKVEYTLGDRFYSPLPGYKPDDLVWVKVHGCSLELDKLKKSYVAELLGISESFKFDKIPTDSKVVHMNQNVIARTTKVGMMDELINNSAESAENKVALKSLFREVMS